MHTEYAYKSNSDISQIYNDLKLLLTGTTNETLLSDSCNLTNTTITAAVNAAGWEYVAACKSYDEISATPLTGMPSTPTNYFFSPTANLFFANYSGSTYKSSDSITYASAPTVSSPIDYADNGNVCFVIRQATLTGWFTVDGTTWTLPTTSVTGAWNCIDAVQNGLFVVAGNGWICATSADNGVTWVSRPALLTALTTGNAQDIACGGGKIMVVGDTTKSAISADGGVTWTAKTPPVTFNKVASGNGLFVGMSNSSATSGVYAHTGTGWETITLPFTFQSSSQLHFDKTSNVFVCAVSSTMLAMSVDGKTWITKQLTSSYDNRCITSKNGDLYTLSASISIKYEINYASGGFRAPNLLEGTYKYMHIDMGNVGKNRVIMRSYESLEQGQWKNLIYNSDNTTACQQLDLVNGGVLYINASARHCAMFSYLTSGAVWGSASGNGWTAIHEYTRDDLWSDASYPSHFWANGVFVSGNCYVARLKTGVGVDTTGASAALSVVSDSAISKPVLDSSGTGQAQAMRSMRVDSNAFATYMINGGKVLGEVFRTTDNYGATLQELTLGLNSYVVWASSSTRYLYLKG